MAASGTLNSLQVVLVLRALKRFPPCFGEVTGGLRTKCGHQLPNNCQNNSRSEKEELMKLRSGDKIEFQQRNESFEFQGSRQVSDCATPCSYWIFVLQSWAKDFRRYVLITFVSNYIIKSQPIIIYMKLDRCRSRERADTSGTHHGKYVFL